MAANSTPKVSLVKLSDLTTEQVNTFLTWRTDSDALMGAMESGHVDLATYKVWKSDPAAVTAAQDMLAAIAEQADRERQNRERLALARSVSESVIGDTATEHDTVSRHVRETGTVTMVGQDGTNAKLRERSINADGDYVVITVVPAPYVTKAQLAEVRADAERTMSGVDVSVRDAESDTE